MEERLGGLSLNIDTWRGGHLASRGDSRGRAVKPWREGLPRGDICRTANRVASIREPGWKSDSRARNRAAKMQEEGQASKHHRMKQQDHNI
jgi:hypothetical protein